MSRFERLEGFYKHIPYKRSNLLILTQNPHKYGHEKSIITDQRCRKWLKHVPIGPKHPNQSSETDFGAQ